MFCIVLKVQLLWIKRKGVIKNELSFLKKTVNGINTSRFISPKPVCVILFPNWFSNYKPMRFKWDILPRVACMVLQWVNIVDHDVWWSIKPDTTCQPCLLPCPIFPSPWLAANLSCPLRTVKCGRQLCVFSEWLLVPTISRSPPPTHMFQSIHPYVHRDEGLVCVFIWLLLYCIVES